MTYGAKRIDSHVIADGIYSIQDYINQGNYLPDENITHDEIRQILGKMLDCIVYFLDGNNLFQTILTCVYVHKSYTIKNPLLRTIMLCYAKFVYSTEHFADKISAFSQRLWANVLNGLDYLQDESQIDVDALRRDLIQFQNDDSTISDIVSFGIFLLDFHTLLQDTRNNRPLRMPVLPEKVGDIGFCKVLHNRQLPTKCPPTVLPKMTHEQAINTFKEMVESINSYRNFPKNPTISEMMPALLESCIEQKNSLIITRFILSDIYFPNTSEESTELFQSKTFEEFLQQEFNRYHIATTHMKNQDFRALLSSLSTYILFMGRSLLLPPSTSLLFFTHHLIPIWGQLQNCFAGYESHLNHSITSYPKTDLESYNSIFTQSLARWSMRLSLLLSDLYLKYGIVCENYNPLDYLELFVFLSVIHSSLHENYSTQRICESIYQVSQYGVGKGKTPKKRIISSATVKKRLLPETEEEIKEEIITNYYNFSIHMMQFILKTNSIKLPSLEFYNQEKTYEDRRRHIHKIQAVRFMEYRNFKILYDPENKSLQQIKNDIKKTEEQVKASIKKVDQNISIYKWSQSLLKKLDRFSLSINQWQEGSTYSITIDDFLPSFELNKP